MTVLIPFLIAFIIGFFVSKKMIELEPVFSVMLLRISLSMGIGIGIISIITFVSLFIPGIPENFLISKLVNRILLVVLGVLICFIIAKEFREIIRPRRLNAPSSGMIILTILFLASFVLVLDRFLLFSAANADGGWDAWAIWNLHARFIYFAGEQWRNLFSDVLVWSHVDYPLMTPAMIVFGWKMLANDSRFVPMILGGVFTFGTIFVLFSSLNYLRNYRLAILGTIILAFTIPFIREGALQYADVPLSYFYLSIIVLTTIALRKPGHHLKLFTLIGLLLGFAAWTKNEGFAFIFSYIAVNALFDIFGKRSKKINWIAIGIGLLPVSIIIILFKSLAPENDITTSMNFNHTLVLLGDLSRHLLVFRNAFSYLFDFSNGIVSIPVLLFFIGLITGINKTRLKDEGLLTGFIIVLTFIIYLFIYTITPKDISWHMQTSFPRLLIQLYPSLLFVVFNLIIDPFDFKGLTKQKSFKD